jgi:exodeoxyribonuclease V alpha subunit
LERNSEPAGGASQQGPSGPVDGLIGTVERFTFRNEDTGFAVVRFRPEGGGETVSLVGTLAQLAEGQQVKVSGKKAVHPRFGAQIEVSACETTLPHSLDGIRAYLSSSLIKGVGPASGSSSVSGRRRCGSSRTSRSGSGKFRASARRRSRRSAPPSATSRRSRT